jgi:uncharacterized membrane protein YdbT with pleckstrin-like domain
MSYIKSTLSLNEKLLHYSHPHVIVFFPLVIWAVLGILLLHYQFGFSSLPKQWVQFLPLAIIFAIAIYALNFLAYYVYTEYGITNRRIIVKQGYLRLRVNEISLRRIASINVQQSICGRILNYGTVTVTSFGDTQDMFNYIPKPLKFHNILREQIEQAAMQDGQKLGSP